MAEAGIVDKGYTEGCSVILSICPEVVTLSGIDSLFTIGILEVLARHEVVG